MVGYKQLPMIAYHNLTFMDNTFLLKSTKECSVVYCVHFDYKNIIL